MKDISINKVILSAAIIVITIGLIKEINQNTDIINLYGYEYLVDVGGLLIMILMIIIV